MEESTRVDGGSISRAIVEHRYLVIALGGDADVKGRKPMQTSVVHGWRCRYDLQTGKFDVPPLFSADNAKAVVPE